jgi:hypothetical protein
MSPPAISEISTSNAQTRIVSEYLLKVERKD